MIYSINYKLKKFEILIKTTLSSSHIHLFSYTYVLMRSNLDQRSNAYFYEARYPSCPREERVGVRWTTKPRRRQVAAQYVNTMLLRTRAATFDIHRPCASNRAPPK